MSSPVREQISAYLTGSGNAAQLVAAVADAFYREAGSEMREALRPILEVIERAAPGIVALSRAGARPGFEVRLAERPFPRRYEPELRQAAQQALENLAVVTLPASRLSLPGLSPASRVSPPGLLRRFLTAIRNLFTS